MQEYIKAILDANFLQLKQGKDTDCPRCGKIKLEKDLALNSFSRFADVYVCKECGMDEAMRDFSKEKPLPLAEWNAVLEMTKGKTFLDLLRSGEEIDCDLIIGGSDMPASFVWDSECKITDYGVERFKSIMIALYKKLPNGNIEIYCDNYKLGEISRWRRPDISDRASMIRFLASHRRTDYLLMGFGYAIL